MKSKMSDKANRLSRQEPIRLQRRPPSLARLDMTKHVGRKEYETKLARLQVRLKELSLAYQSQKRRAVIVLEGWDAAGKGGVIRRMHWPLDPRGLKVWPISAPTPEELDHHYLYRFWTRVPRSGQLVIFDRSWYGRVLVERVEGYATKTEWHRAYAEINEFERMLDDDGIRLVKIFLHITPEEQLARFLRASTTRSSAGSSPWKTSATGPAGLTTRWRLKRCSNEPRPSAGRGS